MIVTLLTDYGHEDEFVGVCHGVLRSIDARTPIVDITHGIPRHDVRRGALVLRNALPYMPLGVHVAIVDPEVGDGRRALALRCRDGRLLVGPDNGLLSLAWRSSGGIERALDVTRSRHRREPVSATFHGRDVFAPVAAALASGADLAGAGETVDPDTLVHLDLAPPRTEDGVLIAHTLLVDGFGNAALDATCEQLGGEPGAAVEVEA
ncbi:MAG: SAM hydrolase/SAM-dependent halogenase family protein, partial [Thermoleophilaceae bacterium]